MLWILAGFLALVTFALYWPATSHDFLTYDDNVYVTHNPHVASGFTLENVRWALQSGYAGNWHPVTWWSHMLDSQFFGLKPAGHHFTGILFHVLNSILVFLLLQRLTGAIWRSLMVAALFALHPLHVESVAWVAERKDVLSAFFGLLALMFYSRYAQSRMPRSGPGDDLLTARTAWFAYALALLCLTLGLMSKAMLVTWPFVMLLLDFWPLARLKPGNLGQLVLEKLPFFALVAISCVVTFLVQQHGSMVINIQELPLGVRCENALVSYGRYLGHIFWPANLTVFYPHPGSWPVPQVALATGLLLVLSALFLVLWRRCPFLLMGWLWFLGTLVPVIGLIQVGDQSMADRYAYLPSLGVFILVVWAISELTRALSYRPIGLSLAGAAAIVACLALTRHDLANWQDSETLYRHALAVTQNNYVACCGLGTALDDKGQIANAITQYQAALELKPDYAIAQNCLATDLCREGRIDEGIRHYQEAIRLRPDYAECHNNFGIALARSGQIEAAISQFQEAVRLNPNDANACKNLARAFSTKSQSP